MGELQDGTVVLRGWLESDLDVVFEARQDAEARRFLAGMPTPFTLADARRYLAFDRQREVGFVIADVVSRTPFGSIWLDRDRGVAEIGYWAAPASRGRGYVSRAVALLTDWAFASGERTIEICTHPENHPAQAVARRCGFEAAGNVERYTLWPDGSTQAARFVRRRTAEGQPGPGDLASLGDMTGYGPWVEHPDVVHGAPPPPLSRRPSP